jgi:hypothetical protein
MAREGSVEDAYDAGWEVDQQKSVGLVQVVLAAFVDHPEIPVTFRLSVGENAIDLVQFQ